MRKKSKAKDDKPDVLGDLEHLLTDIPDEEFDEDSEEDEIPLGPWRGLDWVSKAKTLNEMERYREAIEQCDQALSINPMDPLALYYKGEAYRGLGNFQKALECYKKAHRGRPNDEEIWYAEGVVLKQIGNHKEALAAFEKATQVENTHHDSWYEMAVILRMMGRHEDSRACLEKAFRNYPFEDGDGRPRGSNSRSLNSLTGDSEITDVELEEEIKRNLVNLDSLLGDMSVDMDRTDESLESIPFDIEDEKILLCTLNQSLNIQQIRALAKIPLVSCYKKVRRMEELGLLRRVKVETLKEDPRKKVGYYRTNLKKVKLYMNQGKLEIGIEFKQLIPSEGDGADDEGE